MCLKTPKIPPAKSPPRTPDRNAAQDAAQEARKRGTEQQSTYGSIFTSALGDTGYGGNVQKLARLGGRVTA